MRILFVCTDAEIGGAERFLASLALAKSPHDYIGLAVVMKRGALSAQFETAFDEVHYLGFGYKSRNIFAMARALSRVTSEFRPEIVSSHLFHADLVTLFSRIDAPIVSTVHTQSFGEGDHRLTRLVARTVGLFSKRFAAIIPTSGSIQMQDFLRSLRMRNVVLPIENCAIVPDEYSYHLRSRIILSLARNHPVKGHEKLFEAFNAIASKHPEWQLVAYGPGVEASNPVMAANIYKAGALPLLQSGRISLGGATDFPGQLLKNSAALVISSVHGESFPIVGVEAAGFGIPVISTNLGSCSEFVDDPQLLVTPGDSQALAAALDYFMRLSEFERQALSRAARSRAEASYLPERTYLRYRELFSKIIKARQSC